MKFLLLEMARLASVGGVHSGFTTVYRFLLGWAVTTVKIIVAKATVK